MDRPSHMSGCQTRSCDKMRVSPGVYGGVEGGVDRSPDSGGRERRRWLAKAGHGQLRAELLQSAGEVTFSSTGAAFKNTLVFTQQKTGCADRTHSPEVRGQK